MPRTPVEPKSWAGDPSADEVAHALREQLDAAKKRMREYRAEMEASGLTIGHAAERPGRPV